MQLIPQGTNQSEVHLNDGTVVFFSYSTPVAALLPQGQGYVRTADFFSQTTSRHINKWLDGVDAEVVPQTQIDQLV